LKENLPVTQREFIFPTEQRLISATDTQGKITYCNDEFVAVSGFSREELIGSPHNLVRHPDMPEAVFAHMWSYLKAGKSWMGIVKNRCKSGDFYWVNAYVTPIHENGRVTGFESVRVKPDAQQVRRASELYARMRAGNADVPWRQAAIRAVKFLSIPVLFSGVALAVLGTGIYWPCAVAAVVLPLAQQALATRSQRSTLAKISSVSNHAFDSELIAQTYTNERGQTAQLQMILISEAARIRTALSRLGDYANQTAVLAKQSGSLAGEAEVALQSQRDEADMAATAMNEMAASITEVSTHIHSTADEARQVNELSLRGSHEAQMTRTVIEKLANTVEEISHSVERVAQESSSIQLAANMIRSIADQTNLLALNAAIEAARAGEQGRGFAVVADEVRALASKTQESTKTIQDIIGSLQQVASQAVSIARQGSEEAHAGVLQVISTQEALNGITAAVDRINQMSHQMAAASEEQAHVAEDISRQITSIAQVSDQNATITAHSSRIGRELEGTASSLHVLVERFNG
jgi:aerotaxis receptor